MPFFCSAVVLVWLLLALALSLVRLMQILMYISIVVVVVVESVYQLNTQLCMDPSARLGLQQLVKAVLHTMSRCYCVCCLLIVVDRCCLLIIVNR